MIYVYRTRRLVRIVEKELDHSTDPIRGDNGNPDLNYCIGLFKQLSSKYTEQVARKVLALATGKDYLKIGNVKRDYSHQQLIVRYEGLVLLTPTGYINALGEAVGKIAPVVSIFISLAALTVAILVAILKK
jgi:hypothetical protein